MTDTSPQQDAADERLAAATVNLDREVRALRWIDVIASIVILALLAVLVPLIIESRNATEEIRNGNEIAACRSVWQSRTVGKAQDAADVERDASFSLVLHAIAAGAVAGKAADAAARIDAAEANLATARQRYSALASQSANHPQMFLADCRRQGLID